MTSLVAVRRLRVHVSNVVTFLLKETKCDVPSVA